MTDSYNGWANYETWVAGMFLDGNYDGPGTYLAVLELVAESIEDGQRAPIGVVADALQEVVTEHVGLETESLPSGLAADLLGRALCNVNWRELAEGKLAEVIE